MGNFTSIVTDLENLIQNTLTKAVRMISGPSEEVSNLGKLKEVGKFFQCEEQLIELQKEKDDLANRRSGR